jgi:hypothetical protein
MAYNGSLDTQPYERAALYLNNKNEGLFIEESGYLLRSIAGHKKNCRSLSTKTGTADGKIKVQRVDLHL